MLRIILFCVFFLVFCSTYGSARSTCEQVASFTPQFCESEAAKEHCSTLCSQRNNGDALTCGTKQPSRKKRESPLFRRIVGGEQSNIGEWPWYVSLRMKANGKQWCAGSILSERYILTAAHCFHRESPIEEKFKDIANWEVYAGDHALNITDADEQRVYIKDIYFREPFKVNIFDMKVGYTLDNDIAILVLEEPLKVFYDYQNQNDENRHKGQICLPDDTSPILDGAVCDVAGLGLLSDGGVQPTHLNDVKVQIVSNEACNAVNVYNNTVVEKYVFCAGWKKGGKDACQNDSGGSLVCYDGKGKYHAQGIVSSGNECASPDSYGIYTNLKNYKKWIVDTILTKSLPSQ